MVNEYDWKESRAVYSIFHTIYLAKEISLEQLSKMLKKKYNAISEQVAPLIKIGLVIRKKDGRKTVYLLNKEKVQSLFKIKEDIPKKKLDEAVTLNEMIYLLKNYDNSMYFEKGSIVEPLETVEQRLRESFESAIVEKLFRENSLLKKEIKDLKKKLNSKTP